VQRMLMKRPTVARTSERPPTWLVAIRPTRASDPRTEITRPKDVTAVELGMMNFASLPNYAVSPCTNG
jgi:hypothetical protein